MTCALSLISSGEYKTDCAYFDDFELHSVKEL
jgi:hypothetical protein